MSELRKAYLVLAAATLVLYAALVVGGVLIYITAQNRIEENEKSRQAICAVSEDFHKRAEDTRAFIQKHPNGIPGLPASVLLNSARNQEKTAATIQATGIECEDIDVQKR